MMTWPGGVGALIERPDPAFPALDQPAARAKVNVAVDGQSGVSSVPGAGNANP
jgi:hypothetical protein